MELKKQARLALKNKKRLNRMPALLPPKGLEREYERSIVGMLREMQVAVRERLIAKLPALSKSYEQARPATLKNDADPSDEILRAMDEVRFILNRNYSAAEISKMAMRMGVSVSAFNERIQKEGIKKVLGIDVFFGQPYLKSELNMFATLNTRLITGLKDDTLNKIEKSVMQSFAQGVRAEELAKDIEKMIDPEGGPSASRARLIARDQTNKLNGQLTELRQSELGITRYIWRTSGDERVRDSHAAKEGKIFEWANPPEDTGNPAEDFQCRCVAEPLLSDLLSTASEDE